MNPSVRENLLSNRTLCHGTLVLGVARVLLGLGILAMLLTGWIGGDRGRASAIALGDVGTSSRVRSYANDAHTARVGDDEDAELALGGPRGAFAAADLSARVGGDEDAGSSSRDSIIAQVDDADDAGRMSGTPGAELALGAPGADESATTNEGLVTPPIRLVIGELGIDATIVSVPIIDHAWDITDLGADIAPLGGSAYPGHGSNTVLAGHVTLKHGKGPLFHLEELEPGATITVYDEAGLRYDYAMTQKLIVAPDDASLLEGSETPTLTLITCADWDAETRTYRERLAVVAERD